LAQGFRDNAVLGTDTVDFIHQHKVPRDKKVTEEFRVRVTVGGDKLPCDDDAGSPAASLLETKLIINSTISDAERGARFLTADIKTIF
jgi:hypothetical protein